MANDSRHTTLYEFIELNKNINWLKDQFYFIISERQTIIGIVYSTTCLHCYWCFFFTSSANFISELEINVMQFVVTKLGYHELLGMVKIYFFFFIFRN